jgi:hypothetical protein
MVDLTKIEVKYYGDQDSKLDFHFDELAKKAGLVFDGSGYDLNNNRRDLVYKSIVQKHKETV